jgi:hypothetical protein
MAQGALPAGAEGGQARHLRLRVVGLQVQVHGVLVAAGLGDPLQQQPQATDCLAQGDIAVLAGSPLVTGVSGAADQKAAACRRSTASMTTVATRTRCGWCLVWPPMAIQLTSASRSSRCAGW